LSAAERSLPRQAPFSPAPSGACAHASRDAL
jgi:hypothetical protein